VKSLLPILFAFSGGVALSASPELLTVTAGKGGEAKIEAWSLSEKGKLSGPRSGWSVPGLGIVAPAGDSAFWLTGQVPAKGEEPSGAVLYLELPNDTDAVLASDPAAASGSTTCYLDAHQTLPIVAAANFRRFGGPGRPGAASRGSVDIFQKSDDGVARLASLVSSGSSVHPERQTASHPHCVRFSPDGKILAIADLGTDEVRFHGVSDTGEVTSDPSFTITLPPRSGPRHLDWHPDGKRLYVNTEMSNRIHVIEKTAEGFELTSDVAANPDGGGAPADLKVAPDGTRLATTVRGSGVLTLYEINPETGHLENPRTVSDGAGNSRVIAFSPDSDFLAVLVNAQNELRIYDLRQGSPQLTDSRGFDRASMMLFR